MTEQQIRDLVAATVTSAVTEAMTLTMTPAPEARVTPDVTPAAKGRAITKATRKAFIAAYAKQHGYDISGWSAKDIVLSLEAGTIDAVEGFHVGAGYAAYAAAKG